MSFLELMVVLLVYLMIFDKQDIKYLVNIYLKITDTIKGVKSNILKQISLEKDNSHNVNDSEYINEVNEYIKKISLTGVSYDGSYNLEEIKKFYYKIVKNKKNNSKIK
ncbi:MAG TPA: hypothetical protein QKA14_00130 [Candidatus Megaira endosymbiont of Hartmannula sinica]|nr:hypothetical protein [Candidatus Megaera endosymbiont of Hartmannula sinica]